MFTDCWFDVTSRAAFQAYEACEAATLGRCTLASLTKWAADVALPDFAKAAQAELARRAALEA